MGRSVSTPSSCTAVAYQDISWMGHDFDDQTKKYDFSTYDFAKAQIDWEFYLDWLIEIVEANWPSFEACDQWIGREDHAILRNGFSYIGVSVYDGLLAIWLKPRTDELHGSEYLEDIRMGNFSETWCKRIATNFLSNFGELRKIGSFSNGMAVFEKIDVSTS